MTTIITEERFLSQARKFKEQFLYLQAKFPDDKSFKKLNRVIRSFKGLYGRDKVYAVKQLNYLETVQIGFSEERRALVVHMIELLQKLILHKKLNKEGG
jgi:glucose-6-phosphate 1-dehydrogenase